MSDSELSSLGQGADFAKGPLGVATYDTSPAGLGLNPTYLAPSANLSASFTPTVTLPAGTIVAYAGAVAPAGYVLCDGSTYDGTQSSYAALYTAIGITYGGSGPSAFNVPDLRGRVVVGYAPSGGHADVSTLGDSDGVAEQYRRPKHRHTAHVHSGGAVGSSGGFGGNTSTPSGIGDTGSSDGGSGVSTDSVDAPAYLVVNYLIAL